MEKLPKLSVLIVEDDEGILQDMYRCLEEAIRLRKLHGVDIKTAIYLGSALMQIPKTDTSVTSVVSTDLGYPRTYAGKVDQEAGLALITEILKQRKTNIVVYSGYTAAETKGKLFQNGLLESERDPRITILQKRFDTPHNLWAARTLDALSIR